jgi:hypothetical protein
MSKVQANISSYGFTQPLTNVTPPPIITTRNPLITDQAVYGTLWINKSNSNTYILNSITSAGFIWGLLAISDIPTDLEELTIDPGPFTVNASTTSITMTGNTEINTSGTGLLTEIGNSSNTLVLLGSSSSLESTGTTEINGSPVSINIAPAIGNTVIGNDTGGVTVLGATVEIGGTDSVVEINTTSTNDTTIGNPTSITFITGPTEINNTGPDNTFIAVAGTGAVFIGNTTGNVDLSGQLSLVGPVQVLTGSGAPASGLAINVGDLYINRTAASTTTRLYIATAPGSWTFFTANA